MLTRKLYLNVDEEAWPRVEPFLGFGLSDGGQDLVAESACDCSYYSSSQVISENMLILVVNVLAVKFWL